METYHGGLFKLIYSSRLLPTTWGNVRLDYHELGHVILGGGKGDKRVLFKNHAKQLQAGILLSLKKRKNIIKNLLK